MPNRTDSIDDLEWQPMWMELGRARKSFEVAQLIAEWLEATEVFAVAEMRVLPL